MMLLPGCALIVLYLVYRPVCKMVLTEFLSGIKFVGPWTWKMTEVLVRHHATFQALVKSKMAAVGHVENLTAVLIRRWHMYS